MSSTKKQELGFYARIPRLLRTGYQELSAATKWCYCCLKDLCGDTGTCYRSLRKLAVETGFATGTLSEMIRLLHKVGLIHATKKQRGTGWVVWHISIVDIWGRNQQHCSPAIEEEENCSAGEHFEDEGQENCSGSERTVHLLNSFGPKCSVGERNCSVGETEERTERTTNLKKNTEEERAPFGADDRHSQNKISDSGKRDATKTAVDPDQGLWSLSAILRIAGETLPPLPTHVTGAQKLADGEMWAKAARDIIESPFFRELGSDEIRLRELERILSYMTHPASKSFWVVKFATQHGPNALRLWHVANNARSVHRDLVRDRWQVPPAERATERITEELAPPIVDQVPAAAGQTPTEPRGMHYADATHLAAWIHEAWLGIIADVYESSGGGFALAVCCGERIEDCYAIYSLDAWRVLEAQLMEASAVAESEQQPEGTLVS